MAWDVEEAPYSDSYNSSRSVKTGAHNAHIALSLERPKCPRKTPIQTSSYVSHGSWLLLCFKLEKVWVVWPFVITESLFSCLDPSPMP